MIAYNRLSGEATKNKIKLKIKLLLHAFGPVVDNFLFVLKKLLGEVLHGHQFKNSNIIFAPKVMEKFD